MNKKLIIDLVTFFETATTTFRLNECSHCGQERKIRMIIQLEVL